MMKLTIEPKRPDEKGLYYLKNNGETIARSFRKTKLQAFIHVINEGICTVEDIKKHRYFEYMIIEIEKEMFL